MKGKQHPKNDVTINPSGNDSIRDVIDRIDTSRRRFMQGTLSASVFAAFGGAAASGLVGRAEAMPIRPLTGVARIGFESIPPSLATLDAAGNIVTPLADMVKVPPGYDVQVLASWGDPVMPGAPAWIEDASQDAATQAMQFGMHNDGMHFFELTAETGRGGRIERGLLCVNHEYTHEEILHSDGLEYVPAGKSASGAAMPEFGKPGSTLSVQKVRKSQAAHGVTVMELERRRGGNWAVVPNSRYGRRITANTEMEISGPAAGHALLKTKKYDITPTGSVDTGTMNDGYTAYGTLNNCAHGYTPWGTYLACEENWNGYFGWKDAGKTAPTKLESRYGVARNGFTYSGASQTNPADAKYSIYKWYQADDRFDTAINPNEPNTAGWRVEIDPFDPDSKPVKRTAMGRFKCESAQVVVDDDDHVAFYMGDDERNEYVYKFVCARPYSRHNRKANRDMLDRGTLFVAQFADVPVRGEPGTYRGRWIPLKPDTETVFAGKKLRDLDEFKADTDEEVQALILIKTRMAADAVGATMMDRPEWTAVRPRTRGFREIEVYCTLTNNSRRGNTPPSSNNPDGSSGAASANPPVDAANPRPDNDYGHIIRWRERGASVRARSFEWDIFVLCGDTRAAEHLPRPKTLGGSYTPTDLSGVGYAGNIADSPDGSADFGAPDGLWFDHHGRLWIQTDQAGDGTGDWQKIGSNVMMCADPNTREIRRFLTSPPNCEVTGVITTPDARAMFVGIQHPGEDSLASNPDQNSNWPQGQFATNSAGVPLPNGANRRPRSSVLVITKADGGVIGT